MSPGADLARPVRPARGHRQRARLPGLAGRRLRVRRHRPRDRRAARRDGLMPLDPAFVGRTYPPTAAYLVTREKIAEFANAVGDPNPAYLSVPRRPARSGTRTSSLLRRSPWCSPAGLGAGPVRSRARAGLLPRSCMASSLRLPTADLCGGPARGRRQGREHPFRGRQRPAHPARRGVHRRGRAGLRRQVDRRRTRYGRVGEVTMAATVRYEDVQVGTELPGQSFPLRAA